MCTGYKGSQWISKPYYIELISLRSSNNLKSYTFLHGVFLKKKCLIAFNSIMNI